MVEMIPQQNYIYNTHDQARKAVNQYIDNWLEDKTGRKPVCIGRRQIMGKFEHNRNEEIGVCLSYEDGYRVEIRADLNMSTNMFSYDVAIYKNRKRVTGSKHFHFPICEKHELNDCAPMFKCYYAFA